MEKERNRNIDILKGIGITSIVLGHSCSFIFQNQIPLGPFVYTYHLMIFMFIIGYLIDLDKFEKDKNYKYQYIGKQIIKMLSLYFLYNIVFVLAHNSFVKLNMIDADYYNIKRLTEYIFIGLCFKSNEVLLSALWFIPMMLIAKILFCLLYSKNVFNNRRINVITLGLTSGIIGYLLAINNGYFEYHIQTAILSIFFICIGILFKMDEKRLNKYITSLSWMPSALLIFIILKIGNYRIDISNNDLINPIVFFGLSLLGIYFCLSLAKTISNLKTTKKLFITLGENSFHIMALHLLIIKIIDITYAYIKGINDIKVISTFPYAFSNKLWIIYLILGTIIPVLIITPLKKFKREYIDTMKMY